MVEREQVVFPLRIDHVENDAALEPAHQVGAKLFFLFLVALGDGRDRSFNERVVAQRAGIGASRFHVDAKLCVGFGEELRDVPLIGMLLARAVGLDQFARNVFRDSQHVIALIFSFERGAANRVDRLALLVHHIVVLEQMFTGIKVLRFDAFLRFLDTFRNHSGFDGHAFRHAQAEHQLLHAFAAKNTRQIVFERNEEARRAGVTLAAGASAQLIVNAARLVTFSAENMQSAERDYFIVFRFALLGKLVVHGLPLVGGNLKNLAFVLEQHHLHAGLRAIAVSGIGPNHSGRRRVRHGQLVFQKMVAGHLLGIAAEQNIRAAPGHVRRNCNRPFASGLRHDARLALVLLGVQHLVRNSSLLQQLRNFFRFFDGDRAHQHGLAAFVIVADAVRQRIVFLQDAVDDRRDQPR